MNINPESKPVSEIFPIEGRLYHKIPIFQRNYSWNNANIEELYNDVLHEESGYYIGNLLVTRTDDSYGYEVVDGQQRLTTISLFLLAIHEELSKIGKEYIHSDKKNQTIQSLKTDIRRKLLTKDSNPRLQLLQPDDEIFKNYLNVLDGGKKGKYGNRTFGKRYKFIQDLISDKSSSNSSDIFDHLQLLYEKLNDVELLRITVNDLTDAFSVFTSLNAKGLPLTLIDLLKSYYLSEAIHHFSESDALDNWNQLISIFKNEDGEPNSIAVTQFLQNHYDAFEGEGTSSITKRASLRKYESLFRERGYRYMDTLILNAKIFSKIISSIKDQPEIEYSNSLNVTIHKLSKLEASPIYPLMIYLLRELYEKKVSEETVISVFNYLINYYVRRNIVLKPKSSNIRSKAIQSVRKLQSENNLNDNSLTIIKDFLGQISSSDEEFLSSLSGSVYDISRNTVRFILVELERTHGYFFNKQNVDNLDAKKNNFPTWTLEHILPQNENLSYTWMEMISPDNIDLALNIQKENMHKLGNLTLTGYNSEMSDKTFIDKLDYKPKDSTEFTGLRTKLFINQSIVDQTKDEKIEDKNHWNIQDIERRTKILADLTLNKFPL